VKLIDLSQPLYDGAPNCPAHPPVQSRIIADHPKDGWRVELLTLASHTGSHVDAPFHKLAQGANLDRNPARAVRGPGVSLTFEMRTPINRSLRRWFPASCRGI
jgi:kynurenine formamidase